jgi:FkbM family methyltransferase
MREAFASWLRRLAAKGGYSVRKIPRTMPVDSVTGLNVLELLVEKLVTQRGIAGLFLVQIGANDGLQEDPVRPILERQALSALLCEPVPEAFERLRASYRGITHAVLNQCAVGMTSGELELYQVRSSATEHDRTLVTSFDPTHVEHYCRLWNLPLERITRVTVPCKTVPDLLRESGRTTANIVVTDTEGMDHIICNQFLDLDVPPDIIHFEYCNSPVDSIGALFRRLESMGYGFARSGLDVTAARLDWLTASRGTREISASAMP